MVIVQLIPIHQLGPIGIQQPIILTLETTMNITELFLKRYIIYQQRLIIILLDISLRVATGSMVVIRVVFGMVPQM